MTTLEKISPNIGLNAEAHNSQNADILNNVTMLHEKSEPPLDEKTLSKLSKLSNPTQALEPQGLDDRQLDKTLSNDCLMLSNLSSKNEQKEENAQNITEKCYTCYTEEVKKQPNVTQNNDDVTRRVTLSEKQPIDLKADFAKLSRVNKIAWYAQQGFDVLLGFRGKKGAGTGWNVPNRQRMTPEEAAAKAQAAHRQTNTVLLCGERSTPFNSVGLLVVDVDIKNARNDQERNQCHQVLEDLLGSDVYHQATVTSASGGLHYYIAVPPHQAHLIPKTKKISLASGEEYTRPSVNGNGGKVKAWELELLCDCLVQAMPSTVEGKEYTLNTGIIQQEIPPRVVALIEEYLKPKDEPEAEKPPITEEPRAFVYCLKNGELKGHAYSKSYVQNYAKGDGLYKAGIKKHSLNGETFVEWCEPTRIGNPIYPLATLDDGNGMGFGILLEFDSQHGHTHRHALDLRSFVGDGISLFSVLRDLGYYWIDLSNYRQDIRLWLNNARPDNRLIGKRSTGWTGEDYCFVLPDNVIGDNEGKYYYQGGIQKANIYEVKGNLEAWRTKIALPIVPYPLLCLGVLLGFAPPLLDCLGLDTCGIHLWGESSNGKTTTARIGASGWGNCTKGTNGNNRIVSWNATATGFEVQAALHSSSLLVLDEMGEAEKEDIIKTVYALSDSKGKTRGQADITLRASQTWKLLACSTGEFNIKGHIGLTRNLPTGVLMRLLEIPVDTGDGCGVLEGMTDKKDRQAFMNQLDAALRANYGVACRPYLEYLTELLKKPEELQALRDAHSEITNQFSQDGTNQHSSAAKVFAALALGGMIATQQGLTGWPENHALAVAQKAFNRWRVGFGEGVKEQSTFIEHLEGWLSHNGAHFAEVYPTPPHDFTDPDPEHNPRDTIKPLYGYRSPQGDYWLLPIALNIVRDGTGRDTALTALHKQGWLVDPISVFSKGQTPRKSVAGKQERLLHIRLTVG